MPVMTTTPATIANEEGDGVCDCDKSGLVAPDAGWVSVFDKVGLRVAVFVLPRVPSALIDGEIDVKTDTEGDTDADSDDEGELVSDAATETDTEALRLVDRDGVTA
jgi:hypothetical protein